MKKPEFTYADCFEELELWIYHVSNDLAQLKIKLAFKDSLSERDHDELDILNTDRCNLKEGIDRLKLQIDVLESIINLKITNNDES